jgi:hypothetical protein
VTLTTEDMGRLRVPLAALPGLDPVGLDLVALGQGEWAVHVLDADGPWPQHDLLVYDGRWRTTESWWLHGDGPELTTWAVDLADAATRDRVARQLAGRVGLEVGCTAPSFDRTPVGWALVGPHDCIIYAEPDADLDEFVEVPALADLDPADDRRLPDGSIYRDALAQAIVAVHVGGGR